MQLETPEGSWTSEACEAEISKHMGHLRSQGVGESHVFLFPANVTPETVWLLHALIRLGAVAMPHSPEATADQLNRLQDAQKHPVSSTHRTGLRLTTTGTTGDPKMVDINKDQIDFSADSSRDRLGILSSDRWLCCLPLHHIAGLSILLRTERYGATTVLHSNFDAHRVSKAIDEDNIHVVSLVPTMLQRVMDARKDRPFPPSLRVILLGGAPCPQPLLSRCRAIHAPVSLTWGMTETASQIATRQPGDLREEPDVGKPLDGIDVFLVDGHLAVRGPIAPGGEFVTGDRGAIDPDGRIIVLGRGNALIISGGENIDPRRIEHTLQQHEAIREAAVVGRPDPEWGERPVAFIVLEGHANDISSWLADKLLRHEKPAEIHIVEALPRNEMGKVDQRALAQQARTLHSIEKGLRG